MQAVAPDYVDQIDNGQAAVVSPNGDVRTVAVGDLPAGVKEGHYVAGGQIVPPPPEALAGSDIRAKLAAGDAGGPIDLDASGTAQPAAGASTVMSPLGEIPASTPGLPPATDDAGTEAAGGAAPAGRGSADSYIDSVINGAAEPTVGGPASTPASSAGPDGLPPDSTDLEKRIEQSYEDQKKAAGELTGAQEQGREDVRKAQEDKAELARQQAAEMAAEQLYVRDRQAKLDAEDAANLQRARDEVIPNFWDGHEGALVGAAITAALSGAAGALMGSNENVALNAITHNIDSYYTRERQRVDGLYKYAEEKGLLNDKVRAQYAGELTDLMQQHAYTMQAAAERVQQVSDQAKGLVDQKQAQLLSSQLGAKAAAELQAARKLDIDRYDAETKREVAKADELRAQAAMAKVHRGGGGGTGATDAAQQLAHDIRVGLPDGKGGQRPMTYDEQLAAAKKYGIPPEAKAGHVSLTTVLKGAAFDANQAAKEAKAAAGGAGGLQEQRLLSKEANDWRKENGLDALVKTQTDLAATLRDLKNAPHNPLQQALAIEKAVSAARGGAASRQALDLALHHLGGSLDNAESFISKVKSGEIGQKQLDNFTGFLSNQLGTAQAEGKNKYDAFNKWVESQPAAKQEALKAERGRLFSGLYGFGGRASTAPTAGGGTRTLRPSKGQYAGKTVTVDADNNILSVQ